eukprot:CAMPEP_0183477478 /NCGR_PEP_ID=MMETSP0370-20130417/168285_1 /TAXON_ID=268820 /ORGANISM="Peridinium aciculiferum, Strain PAER-2" /LENGTH=351 /DNA_ID=CAMNT_0025670383 /DNA_START=53 /DNA_END=1108 /DNA_ORIENTATION=+
MATAFAFFNCCVVEDDNGRTVEVVSTMGHGTGDENNEHDGFASIGFHDNAISERIKRAPALIKEGDGTLINKDDILAKPKKLGMHCRKRMPKVGDLVMSLGGKKVGHDNFGNPKKWILDPGECAEVLEIDADGDFRLRNIVNTESGFLFRKEFAYAQEPLDKKQESSWAKEPERVRRYPFDVVVNKEEGTIIGLRVDTMCMYHLEINDVSDGIIKAYNETAEEDKKVREGFFVVGISGKNCIRDMMLASMKMTGEVSLRIAPNAEFKVTVKKTGKVGLVLLVEPQCRSLLVSKVSVGCVDHYNTTARPDWQVKENDRIIEVNGVRADCNKMLELTRTESAELSFVISRPEG